MHLTQIYNTSTINKYMPSTKPNPAAAAVKSAYEYLTSVSPDVARYTNFRVEEILRNKNGGYVITLGYDVVGEFGFDRKREYKEFKVNDDGSVESMKIKAI